MTQVSKAEVGTNAAPPPVTPRPEAEDLTADLDDLEALGDLEQLDDEELMMDVAAATAGSLPEPEPEPEPEQEQEPAVSSQSNPLAKAASPDKTAAQTLNAFTDRDGDGFVDSEDVSGFPSLGLDYRDSVCTDGHCHSAGVLVNTLAVGTHRTLTCVCALVCLCTYRNLTGHSSVPTIRQCCSRSRRQSSRLRKWRRRTRWFVSSSSSCTTCT